MSQDNEARAREVLAHEYSRAGQSAAALACRTIPLREDGGFAIAIRAMLAYQSEAPAQGEGESAADLWQDLLDKDDRTSPEDYPDHALITFDELADYIARATISKTETVGLPLADREAIAREVFRRAGCSEKCAGDAADAILALSGSLPPSPVGEGKDWLADIEIRASNAEALWKEAGSPNPDKCDRVPGSMQYGAMMAFQRLAKDMRSTSPATPPTPAPVRGE